MNFGPTASKLLGGLRIADKPPTTGEEACAGHARYGDVTPVTLRSQGYTGSGPDDQLVRELLKSIADDSFPNPYELGQEGREGA